jgi:hypothetical protein
MEYVMIIFILVVGPLSLLYGADSTNKDTRDTRRWL